MATRGEHLKITLIIDGKADFKLSAWTTLNETRDGELIEDDYLGDDHTSYDHAHKGYKVTMTCHEKTKHWDELDARFVLAMQSRAGGVVKVDIMVATRYPDGTIRTTTYEDIKSGPASREAGGRIERVERSLEFATHIKTII